MKEKVYEFLKTVPRGNVTTYGRIALYLGNRNLARAVGNILHYNPDPVESPCHRVVNSRGRVAPNFAFGAPPHAGMAPGVDRMIMLIAEEETIRDVIAFPLNGNAQDLMMGAPGDVTEQQLREVHIKVRD